MSMRFANLTTLEKLLKEFDDTSARVATLMRELQTLGEQLRANPPRDTLTLQQRQSAIERELAPAKARCTRAHDALVQWASEPDRNGIEFTNLRALAR